MTKEEYISKTIRKFPHLSDDEEVVGDVYEIAKRELLITLFSSNTTNINESTPIPYIYEYKVLEAMYEIIDMGNLRNFTSYSENGWSWSRPEGGLSTYRNIKGMAGAY